MQHSLIEYRVAMEKHYHHLSTTDRVTLMFLKRQGLSLRAIAIELSRSPSTLSRELRRRTVEGRPYDAEAAGLAARSARSLCRPRRKLIEGTDLHEVVVDMLRNKWSPQQISGTLKAMSVVWCSWPRWTVAPLQRPFRASAPR